MNATRGVSRSQEDLGREDASREFRANRDRARRESYQTYGAKPIWGYAVPAKRKGRNK